MQATALKNELAKVKADYDQTKSAVDILQPLAQKALERAVWEWEDDKKTWQKYDTTLSQIIEAVFQTKSGPAKIEIKSCPYVIDFKEMKQKNVGGTYATERPVRRREGECCHVLACDCVLDVLFSEFPRPDYWVPHAGDPGEPKSFELDQKSLEYKKVHSLFMAKALPKTTILKIEWVQCPTK